MTTIEQPGATMLALPNALADPRTPHVAEPLRQARAALASATADYLAIPEAALTARWLWNGQDHGDGVRYGMYRGAETIEAAVAELEAALAGAAARPAGAIRVAPATIARWELQGRLAALDDSFLDRVARDGEWTVRETLAHTIDGQRSYGWFTRWWLTQPLGDDRPARPTEEAERASELDLPGETAEGAGSLDEIRARLDDVLDEWAIRYADLDASALAADASWSGIRVDIDFRLGRWASHIREHAVQLDKTLDWLGYVPSEPARIVRDLHAAWGRLEAMIFPIAPRGTESAVTAILDRCAATLTAEAKSARSAAEA
jgi:DinB family protein